MEDDERCNRRYRRTLTVGTKVARHAPDRLRHDGDCRQLQSVQQADTDRAAQRSGAVSEENEDHGRRQGKSGPGGERAQIAGPHQADREADLTAGGTGQELTKPDQIGVGMLVDPVPPYNELVAEVPDVGDRTAEAGQAEPQENPQNLQRRTRAGPLVDGDVGRRIEVAQGRSIRFRDAFIGFR